MKMLVQRVKHAKVTVDGNVTGAIEQGYLVLLGIAPEDTTEIMEKMVDKLLRLRIFSDENDKINLSLQDVGGSLLLVSQFTLYADCRKGNPPVLCTRHRRHRRKPFMRHARRTVGNGCLWWNPAYSGQICRWNCATTDRSPFCWIPQKSSRAEAIPHKSALFHCFPHERMWKSG